MAAPNELQGDTVMVFIEATESVTYARTVKLPRAEFDQLQRDLDSKTGRESAHLEEVLFERFIDRQRDWQDSDDMELSEFRVATAEEAE